MNPLAAPTDTVRSALRSFTFSLICHVPINDEMAEHDTNSHSSECTMRESGVWPMSGARRYEMGKQNWMCFGAEEKQTVSQLTFYILNVDCSR